MSEGRKILVQKDYSPIIKSKGFDPSPVAGKIPFFADSRINPDCYGTPLYNEFWEEQIDRCVNGYVTAGLHIPGRYYWYLNFVVLIGLMGSQYPFYVDLDLEFFRLVDAVKQYRLKGLVGLKGRRKGVSEKMQGGVLQHGLRFVDGYRAAITAGRERYVVGLKKKLDNSEIRMIDEFKLNILINNAKNYETGFEIKNRNNVFQPDGFLGKILTETMYDNPAKLEGEFFHDVVCEESGEYETIEGVVSSIGPALDFGAESIGTFYIYGTAGNILGASQGFKEFYDNAEKLGYAKIWIPGTRMYYPFFGNDKTDKHYDPETDVTVDAIPNLRHLKPHERIGCEDLKAAEQEIIRKRSVYLALHKRKKLKEFMQDYPLTEEEAWTSSGSNNFNNESLVAQLITIEGEQKLITPWILDFVTVVENGITKVKVPLEVKARPAKSNDREWEIVWIYQHPRPDIVDLDVGGFDSYNQDLTETSKSLGAAIVTRRGKHMFAHITGIHNAIYPIALHYARPPRKELSYEIALKMSVYYGLRRNMMINAEQDFAISFFQKNGGERYLAPRPKSFDSPTSQQVHKYGMKLTGASKPAFLGFIQSVVEDDTQYNFFPRLIRDLIGYDEVMVGEGDWDSADAFGLSIARAIDMRVKPRPEVQDEVTNEDPQWIRDKNGNFILKKNYDVPDNVTGTKNIGDTSGESKGGWKAADPVFSDKNSSNKAKEFDEFFD